MALIHNAFIKVLAEAFECEYHVVDFHTVYQLSIVSQFHLYTVELSIELF